MVGFALLFAWIIVACIVLQVGREMDNAIVMAVGGVMVLMVALVGQINY